MYYYDDMPVYNQRQQTPFSPNMMQGAVQPQFPQFMPQASQDMNVLPTLPTGIPGGPLVGPVPGPQTQAGAGSPVQPVPPAAAADFPSLAAGLTGGPTMTLDNPQFVPGFLRTQIGRTVRVEFLIGTNGPLVDRVGTLIGVGTSYILIQPIETDDVLLCDLYAIKFVTFLL